METSILNSIRSRPRFKLTTPYTREAYEQYLKTYLSNHQHLFTNSLSKENTVIGVKTKEDYFWKPFLTLRSETEEGKTVIRGIFGPSTAVWTFYMFIYMGLAVLAMTFLTLWYVTHSINNLDYPWASWASVISLILLFLTWLSGFIARKKAAKEMGILRRFAEESMQGLDFQHY